MRKPGYLTTEFWLVVFTITLTNVGALPVPEKFRWVVTLGSIVGYALARALAKFNADIIIEPSPPADDDTGPGR